MPDETNDKPGDTGAGRLRTRLDDHEKRLTWLEAKVGQIEKENDRLDELVREIQETVTQINQKISALTAQNATQMWILGFILATVLSSMALRMFGK